MKTKILTLLMAVLAIAGTAQAEDHVMAATKSMPAREVPASLSLSLEEAQDYAVNANRSLRNAEIAVQQAYAQRWQTIAAMLPQADLSWGYQHLRDSAFNPYKLDFGPMQMTMPDNTTSISVSVGLNGQAIVGALLQNVAIDMQKLQFEQSENDIRANIISSYASVLVLQDIVGLLNTSLDNINKLYEMTLRSVEVGAAEQTAADQIRVRVNTFRNNINSNKRSIQLAESALKVLLDVPVTTEITLTTSLKEMLSVEAIMNLLGEDFIIQNNLNYQLLEKNVDLAKKNVHMAAWAYGPTIGFGYQYSKPGCLNGEKPFSMSPPHAFAVNFSMPLWSSGKRAAGVVEKKIALEEARNTFAETADNLGIQNQQLRYNLQNAYETYLNEQDNIEVTGRVFESVTNKYNYGSASNLELVNASNDLISAQSTYVQAVLSLVNAQAELKKFLNIR